MDRHQDCPTEQTGQSEAKFRAQLVVEIGKPICNHKTFIDLRDAIDLLVSMIEMAYGLPYKHEDTTTAINLVDAQLELNSLQQRMPPGCKSVCDSDGHFLPGFFNLKTIRYHD